MLPPEIQTVLAGIGLSKPETAVYLASLTHGSRPASVLAKKAGLKRGQTYHALHELVQKGIMQEFVRNNVTYFTCGAPESVVSIFDYREHELRQQRENFLNIVPKLQAAQAQWLTSPKVRSFHGPSGVMNIFVDMLHSAPEAIYALVDVQGVYDAFQREMPHWIERWVRRRIKSKIWYYGLVVRSERANRLAKNQAEAFRTLKAIGDLQLPMDIHVYGEKVAMITPENELMGVIIEDARFATALKNVHQLLWNFSPDYEFEEAYAA